MELAREKLVSRGTQVLASASVSVISTTGTSRGRRAHLSKPKPKTQTRTRTRIRTGSLSCVCRALAERLVPCCGPKQVNVLAEQVSDSTLSLSLDSPRFSVVIRTTEAPCAVISGTRDSSDKCKQQPRKCPNHRPFQIIILLDNSEPLLESVAMVRDGSEAADLLSFAL